MNYAFTIVISFFFSVISNFGTSQYLISQCSKGRNYYSQIEQNYYKGAYIYPAKIGKTTFNIDGTPIYNIKKKNKEITYLNNLTKIYCSESKDGTYIVSIETLGKWKDWFIENCR
jgi:hypothetical protein